MGIHVVDCMGVTLEVHGYSHTIILLRHLFSAFELLQSSCSALLQLQSKWNVKLVTFQPQPRQRMNENPTERNIGLQENELSQKDLFSFARKSWKRASPGPRSTCRREEITSDSWGTKRFQEASTWGSSHWPRLFLAVTRFRQQSHGRMSLVWMWMTQALLRSGLPGFSSALLAGEAQWSKLNKTWRPIDQGNLPRWTLATRGTLLFPGANGKLNQDSKTYFFTIEVMWMKSKSP